MAEASADFRPASAAPPSPSTEAALASDTQAAFEESATVDSEPRSISTEAEFMVEVDFTDDRTVELTSTMSRHAHDLTVTTAAVEATDTVTDVSKSALNS